MPNHVMNRLTFECPQERLDEILAAICYDADSEVGERTGPGTIDFNKIIPMPPSLDIESGSRTIDGINLYLTSINPEVPYYGTEKMDQDVFRALLKNLGRVSYFTDPKPNLTKAEIERCTKYNSAEELLQLGKAAVDNKLQYGATTWYEWRTRPDTWNTKWNSYYPEDYSGGDEIAFQTAWSPPHPIIQKVSEMFPDVLIQHRWANEDPMMDTGYRHYFGGEEIESYTPVTDQEHMDMSADVWMYDPEESEVEDFEQT